MGVIRALAENHRLSIRQLARVISSVCWHDPFKDTDAASVALYEFSALPFAVQQKAVADTAIKYPKEFKK